MKDRTWRFAFVLSFIAIATLGRGQCAPPSWNPANELPGIAGPINAAVEWDPDGAGPTAPVLVCGGYFQIAGNLTVQNLASFDGAGWHGVGSGITGQVYALAVYNNDLIVGGLFTAAGGIQANNVARWNGVTWSPLGSGTSGTVSALAVYNGELIAAGGFANAGGNSANGIARWNGASWQPLGAGLDSSGANALAVYQGNLIAGGWFSTAGGAPASRIAQWNGSAWQPLGAGLTNPIGAAVVKALAVFAGNLVAAGIFDSAGGTAAKNVATWNGTSWQAAATAMGPPSPDAMSVNALAVCAGELIAGGNFVSIDGVNANRLARWNGSAWQPLGSGIGPKQNLNALTVFAGDLIACGVFGEAGGTAARNVARWNGTKWSALTSGIGTAAFALAPYGGGVAAAGLFCAPGGNAASRDVVVWDGSSFQALGSGFDGSIYALYVQSGTLFAGGKFTQANGGSTPAIGVSQWSGFSWIPVGGGLGGVVKTFGTHNGELIAGGYFGGGGIARFDGTNWQPIGGGMSDFVNAVAVYNGELVAAGRFVTAGTATVNGIARWNGSAWQPLGSGVTSSFGAQTTIYALAIYNGELIAGGNFTSAGGVACNHVAKWNGVAWQPVGPGFPFGDVLALRVHGAELFAGGSLSNYPFEHIARWNGATWQACGSGIGGNVWALSALDGALIAGGDFLTAGGIPSPYLARWSSPLPMLGFSQPQSGMVQVDDRWLVPSHEYYNIVSTDLSPGTVGTGPYGGLWFNDPAMLMQQVALPPGTAPFHFVAPGTSFSFGPYPLPPGISFEAISVDVTGGVIGCLAPAQRYTVY
jgi:hypothetical protein